MKILTIKISDGHGGFIIINKSDYDAKKHKLFVKESKKKPKTDDGSDQDETTEIQFIKESDAEKMNRDQLRDYAKQFGITGRSEDGIFNQLKEAGKFRPE